MKYKFTHKFICKTTEDTEKIGKNLAKYLPNGTVVCLIGDLAAGKTTLVKGVAKGLNILDKVLSPTFNIMKIYSDGDRPLVHIDAYRLEEANSNIGLDEFIGIESGLTFIEWPKFISELIDFNTSLIINFNVLNDTREITLSSNVLDFEGFKND